ncbi:hypothetical protein NXS19_009764 [Fusarium pseudograminearum]|nr:hypothetical protein NXS19_009764 [Fusarium pseudograminearum]
MSAPGPESVPTSADPRSHRPTKKRALTPVSAQAASGSSAGAGSGEFHVYKASRRREYERLRSMDEDLRREKDIEEFGKDKKGEDEGSQGQKKGKGPAGATDKKPNTALSRGDSPSADNDAKTNTADVASKTQAGKDTSESAPSAQPAGLVIHDDDD